MEFKLKTFQTDVIVSRIANIHYFEFTNNYTTASDFHNFHELVYVDTGDLFISSDNYEGVLKKNQLIIHAANEKHLLSCNKNNAPNVIIIGFECQSQNNYLDYFSKNSVTLSVDLQGYLAKIIKEGRIVFLPPYDQPNLPDMKKRSSFLFGADQLIKNFLEIFLINLIRENIYNITNKFSSPVTKTEIKMIDDVKNYIDENLTENITLNELCFMFATNKTTLCKEFKKLTQYSIIDYINTNKIKLAKEKIRAKAGSFTQIAENLNFSSIHYFTRVFIKYENMTPTEYANSIKSKFEK